MSDECAARTQHELDWGEQLLGQLAHAVNGGRVKREDAQIAIDIRAWLKSSLSLFRMGRNAGIERYRHLREALIAHRKAIGTTFEPTTEDPIYFEAAKRLSGGHRKVVAFGHTHLAKSIELPEGGKYVNSGTWCPTIRLREELYMPGDNDPRALAELQQFVDDLAQNRLDDWTTLETTFVDATTDEGGRTQASLWEFSDQGPKSLERQ
jgi:hypothetical protein